MSPTLPPIPLRSDTRSIRDCQPRVAVVHCHRTPPPPCPLTRTRRSIAVLLGKSRGTAFNINYSRYSYPLSGWRYSRVCITGSRLHRIRNVPGSLSSLDAALRYNGTFLEIQTARRYLDLTPGKYLQIRPHLPLPQSLCDVMWRMQIQTTEFVGMRRAHVICNKLLQSQKQVLSIFSFRELKYRETLILKPS
jgi:hypothetical protein